MEPILADKASRILVTWVITDGLYDGAAEIMSEAMQGYVEAYGLSRRQVIGVVPWLRMSFQADLHKADFVVKSNMLVRCTIKEQT